MSPESFQTFNRMNHDLRTQLNVMSSGLHLLKLAEGASDYNRDIMKRVCRSIEKADSILDLTYDELRKENE